MAASWQTWREATTRALYGPDGFYRRPEGPRGHFRTSVHASDQFAAALARLACSTGLRTVVDVGAGRGELATAFGRVAPELEMLSVDPYAPPERGLATELPPDLDALVVANEWLDDVPVDVVELTADGPRVVEVAPGGAERVGGPPSAADLDWLAHWWPLTVTGERAEVGRPRDIAWADVVRRLSRGIAIVADYGHTGDGRPAYGTLTGYAHGRQVSPVPDGRCDITVHIAVDACAAAGVAAGATDTTICAQRDALRALGVRSRRPPGQLARTDPAGYVRALNESGEATELLDPSGLGGFCWLVQAVGMRVPAPLAGIGVAFGPRTTQRDHHASGDGGDEAASDHRDEQDQADENV